MTSNIMDICICEELQRDSKFTSELQRYKHWDCRAVRESIASVKKGVFEAVADMVMRTARGILAQ